MSIINSYPDLYKTGWYSMIVDGETVHVNKFSGDQITLHEEDGVITKITWKSIGSGGGLNTQTEETSDD